MSDFGLALTLINQDRLVKRKTWKNQCIFLIRGRTVDYNVFQSWENNANWAFKPPKDIEIRDHIDAKLEDGTYLTGWTPTQEDMLATDWEIVQ